MAVKPNTRIETDPGVGSSYRHKTKRTINHDGSFNVKRVNGEFTMRDAYLFLVRIPWWLFLLFLLLSYLLFNVFFASLYLIAGVEGMSGFEGDHSWVSDFLHAFFFSVQTFTTVGYGSTSPMSLGVNLIATIEAMTGLLSFSVATGILYGRFSRPTERILFSDKLIISPYKNGNAIMFRVMNGRSNILMDLNITITLGLNDSSKPGYARKFYRLTLELDNIKYLPLSWTIVHPLDENSPLNGVDPNRIPEMDGELMITISGFDDTYGQEVYRRFSYELNEITLGEKFKRNFHVDDEGYLILDQKKLNDTETISLNK
jgi:inward rectifier potassium channel